MKNCKDFQSEFTSIVNAFPIRKDVQSAVKQGEKHACNHEDLSCTGPTNTSLQQELVQTTAAAFFGGLFHAIHTPANQLYLNYHIKKISSNILSLDFSSSNTGLLTHSGVDCTDPNNKEQVLKQCKPIWEEPLCSGHLSIPGTILRSQWCPLQRFHCIGKSSSGTKTSYSRTHYNIQERINIFF